MGVSCAHERPRVHPSHRPGTIHGGVSPQPRVQRLPRDSRTHLRPALRAGLPPDARRWETGRHLPAEAGCGGQPRRGQASPADGARDDQRQENRAHRRWSGLAHGRQRPRAAGLRGHDSREAAAAGRADAHQHPGVPPSGIRPRRGNCLHRRHGSRGSVQLAGQQPEGAPRQRRVRCGVCRERRAQGERARHSGPARHGSDLHRHRVARVDSFRPRGVGRQARAHHRRRQHGDGLLPVVEAARRDRCEGHRAQDEEVLQGFSLGARGRRRRRRRDHREPAAGPLHHRERRADRDGVRQVPVGRDGQGPPAGNHRAGNPPVRHGRPRDWPGQRVPVHRTGDRARVRQVGHAGRRQDDVHVDQAGGVLRWRRGVRPGQHHLGGRARPSGSHLDSQLLPGHTADGAARRRDDADEHEDGPARMGLQQQLQLRSTSEDDARRPAGSFCEHVDGSGEGVHGRADARRGRAVPELRHGDALHRLAVHRVRRLHRHLPGRLFDDHAKRRRARVADPFRRAGRESRSAALCLDGAQADRARDDQGRERLPALRFVRRTLPDLRVGHAEVHVADSLRRRDGDSTDCV